MVLQTYVEQYRNVNFMQILKHAVIIIVSSMWCVCLPFLDIKRKMQNTKNCYRKDFLLYC